MGEKAGAKNGPERGAGAKKTEEHNDGRSRGPQS